MQATRSKSLDQPPAASVSDFGTWLARQIDRMNFRRSEVADRAQISRSTISMLINGKSSGERIRPDEETVDKIADAMSIPRSIARIAAGYAVTGPDPDLDFCADMMSVIRTLSPEKQEPLKDMLRDTVNRWAMFTTA